MFANNDVFVSIVVAVLFNCAEPEAITAAFESLSDLKDSLSILLGAYANRLTPVSEDWSLQESDTPQSMREDLDPERYYNEFVSVWQRRFGIQVIGGCCGITPEHIKYIHEKL